MPLIPLGSFSLTGSRLRVCDPCYTHNVWCQTSIDVMPGTYSAYLNTSRKGGIMELIITHSTAYPKGCSEFTERVGEEGVVGVDSGQAGFFDDSKYPDFDREDKRRKEFYARCCKLTLSRPGAGIIPEGVVSGTYHGDGGYNCYVSRNTDGVIVAARIDFDSETSEAWNWSEDDDGHR